jgi:hypothetical protein
MGAAGGYRRPASAAGHARGQGADQVAQQVTAVATSIALSNPQLPESECRGGRRVVGSYLRPTADLAGSVISDEPVGDPAPGRDRGDGGGGNMLEHGLEWRGLKGLLPGGGGAGAAGELAGAAELAAL